MRNNAAERRKSGGFPPSDGKTHTEGQWQNKFFSLGSCCYYCKRQLTLHGAVKDHGTPLCRGGSDKIQNIWPACAPCNSMKAWRTQDEFTRDFHRLLQRNTERNAIGKPKIVRSLGQRKSLEEIHNEPGLLRRLNAERERTSWSWRNPA